MNIRKLVQELEDLKDYIADGVKENIACGHDKDSIRILSEAIAELKHKENEGWILCKECMPEEGLIVLVNVTENGEESILVGCCNGGCWSIRKNRKIFEPLEVRCEVTAWQELPLRYGLVS